ncbi:MAG: hypothetical protein RBQ87_04285 [Candidatus Cloacimonadaceae bacterium]|jgi:hypothetical protein|nr:hypothetical protein [Candidatus Cloacimonadaceae bacterium]
MTVKLDKLFDKTTWGELVNLKYGKRLVDYRDNNKQYANGSTFLEISKENFRQIKILVPCDEVLKQFTNLGSAMFTNLKITAINTNMVAKIMLQLQNKLIN